jgi:rare lipoprotein A
VHSVKYVTAVLIAMVIACGGSSKSPPKKRVAAAQTERDGLASWYGGKHHGGPTASGERFNKRAMTAAHRKFPFGTRVRVTNLKNGKSVVVRINDRGPYGRAIIDVSEAAAEKLDMIRAGVVPVKLERLP